MKISKIFLKKIILEETKKILLNEQTQQDIIIKMPAKDFLALTTNDDILSKLEKDLERNPINYSAARVDDLLLVINDIGDVITHEGRHRALANIKKNGQHATNNVIIRINKETIGIKRYQEFINSGYVFTGEFDKNIELEPKNYELVTREISSKDFLKAEQGELIFKPIIRPPHPPYTYEEYVESGYEQAARHINLSQYDYAKYHRHVNNIDELSREEFHIVANNFEKYVNDNYIIKDSDDNKLEVINITKNKIQYSFKPLPNPKSTIIIEKK